MNYSWTLNCSIAHILLVFTKCKDNLENGHRLENLSWRLWYKSTMTQKQSSTTLTNLSILADPMACDIPPLVKRDKVEQIDIPPTQNNINNNTCLYTTSANISSFQSSIGGPQSVHSNISTGASVGVTRQQKGFSPLKPPLLEKMPEKQSNNPDIGNSSLVNGQMDQQAAAAAQHEIMLARQQQLLLQHQIVRQHLLQQQQKTQLVKPSSTSSNLGNASQLEALHNAQQQNYAMLNIQRQPLQNAPPQQQQQQQAPPKTSARPKFFISEGGNTSNSQTSTLSYSGSSRSLSPSDNRRGHDSDDDYYSSSDSDIIYDSEEDDEYLQEQDRLSDASSLDNSKSLFSKQQLPTKRPSLLSVALQRNAFRNSQTQLAGLVTSSGAPVGSSVQVLSDQEHKQIAEMAYMELTPSIRETLKWDHAQPFGMRICTSSQNGSQSSSQLQNMQESCAVVGGLVVPASHPPAFQHSGLHQGEKGNENDDIVW